MIGYYVHHRGTGHVHRASALAEALSEPLTGLSSLPRPAGWPGSWVTLDLDVAPDDADGSGGSAPGPAYVDPTARGRLHWVPRHHPGLRSRMAEISEWIEDVEPEVMVVDVSVEVCLLARLHGVPVVTVVQPGERGDPAHQLALEIADGIVGLWPREVHTATGGMVRGLPAHLVDRVVPVGGLSRFPVRTDPAPAPGPEPPPASGPSGTRHVAVVLGSGGDALTPALLEAARQQTPGWTWSVLGGQHGPWVERPEEVLAAADVVVTHAGQNALAEVASLQRPAVVVPQERPHAEQLTTAAVLACGDWPALVETAFHAEGWAERLERAAALDGTRWRGWTDGLAASRFADVVHAVRKGDA